MSDERISSKTKQEFNRTAQDIVDYIVTKLKEQEEKDLHTFVPEYSTPEVMEDVALARGTYLEKTTYSNELKQYFEEFKISHAVDGDSVYFFAKDQPSVKLAQELILFTKSTPRAIEQELLIASSKGEDYIMLDNLSSEDFFQIIPQLEDQDIFYLPEYDTVKKTFSITTLERFEEGFDNAVLAHIANTEKEIAIQNLDYFKDNPYKNFNSPVVVPKEVFDDKDVLKKQLKDYEEKDSLLYEENLTTLSEEKEYVVLSLDDPELAMPITVEQIKSYTVQERQRKLDNAVLEHAAERLEQMPFHVFKNNVYEKAKTERRKSLHEIIQKAKEKASKNHDRNSGREIEQEREIKERIL